MSGRPLPRVFNLLNVEKDPAVDDALREALPHLDEFAREAALKLICDRGRPATLAAMLVSYGSFDPALQAAVVRRLDAFHPGLRAALQSEKFEERAAAISVVVAAGDYKSAHSLADTLRSSCARTRELAADAIRKLTDAHITRRRRGISPADAADFHQCAQRLGEVLQGVLKNWETHQHIGVLEAALWMFDSVETVLIEKMSHPGARISYAVNTIMGRGEDPRLAGFVVRSLAHAALRPAAAKAIMHAHTPEFLGALMDEMWLLTDPQIGLGFRGIHEIPGFAAWLSGRSACDPQAGPVAVRVLASLGGPREAIISRLSALAEQSDEPIRRAAFWQMVADESPGATHALAVIASRGNDRFSAIASREFSRREQRSAPVTGLQSHGAAHPLREALERFIEEHDRLSPAERESLAAQFKSLGPELEKQLERKLECPRTTDRVGAMRAIRTLSLVPSFVTHIYRLAHDQDSLIRSAALGMLGQDGSPTARRLLREALNDPDPRVQAVAIEELERLGIESVAQPVRAKLDSKNNRVRANAIKALWRVETQQAARELEKMLKDGSAQHRASALWVVERLKIRPVLAALQAMSRSDPDPRVRSRAQRVLDGMALSKEPV